MSLKDFFYFAAVAWQLITAHTIEDCWMRGLTTAFSSNTTTESEQAKEPASVGSDSDDEEFLGLSAHEV